MTLQISCPNCGSHNVQSFKVIHSYGTSELTTDSTTVGEGIVAGHLAFGAAKTKTKGMQQTEVGKLTAPPMKRSLFLIRNFIGWGLLTGILLKFPGGIFGEVLALLFTWVIGNGVYQSIQFNRTVWPRLYDEWAKKYLCNTCGAAFDMDSDN